MKFDDIMGIDPTLAAADAALEARAMEEKPRGYLGMSSIGDSCSRKLWYHFRHSGREVFTADTLKKFEDGHRTEDLVIDRLRLVEGLDIVAKNPDGGQIRIVDHDGHFSGHLDGAITGLIQAPKTPHILEVKCCGEKTYSKFKKSVADYGEKAALKAFSAVYFGQAQAYMGYMGYTRHYIVVATAGGRDWTSARTEFDPAFFLQLKAKAKRIIDAQEPPERVSNDKSWFECKWCTFYGICHEQDMPARSCRTCLHSTAMSEGTWHCERYGKTLTLDEQIEGCPAHKFIPALVPGEVGEVTEKGITYKMQDGTIWKDTE